MRKILGLSGITAFFLLTLAILNLNAADETLTITTYYPTPQGTFNNLDVKGNLTVSGTVAVGTTNPGSATVAILSTVGIGTTAPSEKVEINGNLALSTGGNRTIKIPSGGDSAGNDLTVSAGDSEYGAGGKLTLKGGYSPADGASWGGKVELTGATQSGDGGDVYITGGSAADYGGDVYISGGNGDEENDGKVILGYNGTTWLGNIGIGTLSPASRLSVGGEGFLGTGIYGSTSTSRGAGVYGYSSARGITFGVYGYSSNNGGGETGVYGRGETGVRGAGSVYGVYGGSDIDDITYLPVYGVYGIGSSNGVYGGSDSIGVYGMGKTGVHGVSPGGVGSAGVYGVNNQSCSSCIGVWGTAPANGVRGIGTGASSTGVNGSGTFIGTAGFGGTYGVYGSGTGSGVYGTSAVTGVYGDGSTQDFYSPHNTYGYGSSIRWKRNISKINGALDKILNLRGVYFDWDKAHGGKHSIGFIAEEVGEYIPEAVIYDDTSIQKNHYLGKNGKDRVYASGMYSDTITPILVEAIKEQQKQINDLKKEIASLKGKL